MEFLFEGGAGVGDLGEELFVGRQEVIDVAGAGVGVGGGHRRRLPQALEEAVEVAGVVPGSTAEGAEIERGDLVTRINGEPVAKWDFRRYEKLVTSAREIVFTFLNGTRETEKRISVFDLVP